MQQNKFKYLCIKSLKERFGSFHAGKIYTDVRYVSDDDSDLVYIYCHEKDMIDYEDTPEYHNKKNPTQD